MSIDRDFTGNELERVMDLLDGAEPVAREAWRHGHKSVYVFPFDGKFWMVTIPVHADEGWQYGKTLSATQVVARDKVITEWVPIEAPDATEKAP